MSQLQLFPNYSSDHSGESQLRLGHPNYGWASQPQLGIPTIVGHPHHTWTCGNYSFGHGGVCITHGTILKTTRKKKGTNLETPLESEKTEKHRIKFCVAGLFSSQVFLCNVKVACLKKIVLLKLFPCASKEFLLSDQFFSLSLQSINQGLAILNNKLKVCFVVNYQTSKFFNNSYLK